jgi:D-alanyl-D-alanine dipeptidase
MESRFSRPLVIIAFLSLVSCSSREFHVDDADSHGTAVVGTPDGRQIEGTLTVSAPLTSEAGNGRTYCTLPAGRVLVARYQSGFYRVYTVNKKPCAPGVADSFRGWVPAASVEIADTAYFGKVTRVMPNSKISVESQYATNQIFCTGSKCLIKEPLYGKNRCYVHPKLAGLVQNAAIKLDRKRPGHKLVLLDCYRPVYVQQRIADLVKDPMWVAQPSPPRFGGHNGGIAIDVTMRDASGQRIDMGSGYDEFTARSNYAASGLTAEQKAARKDLRDVMIETGLKPYDGEWWHFSLDISAEPLDLAL